MKNKVVVSLSWILVLLVMLIIFQFSAENGEKSVETSGGVVEDVLEIFMEKEEITPQVVSKYQYPIRKLAHFGIYMLLGFTLINAFKITFNKKIWINSLFSAAVALAYASSDELHQKFSGGRGPAITDVLIDFSGAVVGIIIFVVMIFVLNLISKRSRKE